MATDVAPQGVNGYANHNGYSAAEPYSGATYSATSQPFTPAQPTSSTPATASQPAELGKDEVGWFFVEQYYTTLSRNPDKLHLYYNKRSQYVSGNETDKVPVCVGQRSINDRIKELGFQDCKVRITNVDSQASDANIVIQVIGEISNKSQPHRKFTQTFVLAQQTNGYFVLNDIFRYIIEEEEELDEAAAQPEDAQKAPAVVENGIMPHEEAEPKTLANSGESPVVEKDAEVAEKKSDEKVVEAETAAEEAAPTTNGTSASHDTAEETTDGAVVSSSEEPAASEPAASEPAATETAAEEKPVKASVAAPVASPAKQTPAAPAAAPKPAVPKTWASLAASAARTAASALASASASAPAPAPASAPATQTQQRPAPVAKQAAATASTSGASPAPTTSPAPSTTNQTPSAPVTQRDTSPTSNSADEWTAVSSGHNRQQSRAQTNNGQREPENVPNSRGYIKNVGESIVHADLQAALVKFGEVVQFDISRPRNCAFIDYKTPEAYQAAVAANPHVVNGEKLWVEERRVRLPGTPGYNPRGAFNQMRGGGGGRGAFRGGAGGERGGFAPRGRGGPGGAPRGRGAPQAA